MSEQSPTYKQINEQQSSAYRRGDMTDPTVLIERSSGQIHPGWLDISTRDVHFFDPEDGNKPKYHPNVSPELLTDAHQEKLAIALAGGAALLDELDDGSAAERVLQPEKSEELTSFLSGIKDETQSAINQSGHVDPCMLAFKLFRQIDGFTRQGTVNPEAATQLNDVKELLSKIGSSGNDNRSPYYMRQKDGLITALEALKAI